MRTRTERRLPGVAPTPDDGAGPGPGRRARWRDRLSRWSVPEVLLGAVIAGGWAAAAGLLSVGSLPLAALAMAATVWMHLGAVESGNHTLAWMTTGLVVLFAIIALAGLDRNGGPLGYSAAATTALAHSDLVRLNYARRRRAQVDPGLYATVAGGVILAGLVAGAGVVMAQRLSGTTDRNWLWMPLTVAAVLVVAVALTVFPVRRAPAARRERWRAGDRIPPPPPENAPSGPNATGAGNRRVQPGPDPGDGWSRDAGPVA